MVVQGKNWNKLRLSLIYFTFDRVGRNVAAGMTGGLAYILDEDDTFIPKVCARDPFHSSFSVFLLQMSVCMDY